MAEKKEVALEPKFRSWLTTFIVVCFSAVILCWSIFGMYSYLYPQHFNYTFRPNKTHSNQLPFSGNDGLYFVTLPLQQIQLAEKHQPARTLEVQIAFAIKNSDQISEIESKLPLIQDMLITYLRTTTTEELQENKHLFYLKEALLERTNSLLFPTQIQDVLFQKIIIKEGI